MVEIVAVMVIVAILAVTATPVLSTMGNGRAGAAARQMQRDVSFARQWAVATGTRTWARFNVGGQTWSLYVEDPENPGKGAASIMTDAVTGREYRQSLNVEPFQGVTMTSVDFDGNNYLGFDWLGQPLNTNENPLSADGQVILNSGHTLIVEAGTGHVRLVQP